MNSTAKQATLSDLDFVKKMPKVELHVHLEGSMDAPAVREMAQRNGITLPVPDADLERFFQFQDFDHFLSAYYAATSTMLTLEDWRFMIDRFMEKQAAQNIVYTEAFISASHHLDRFSTDEWINVMSAALEEGSRKHGVKVRLIPDISREVPETSLAVLDFCTAAWDRGLGLGMGLGGPEQGFPPDLFVDVFSAARQRGMHVVAHAGETEGTDGIRGAWEKLGAERIGHGIRVLDDNILTKEMAEASVPFEVNPTSNYCIGVVDRSEAHPIRKMVDAGLFVTVNSDDPALFGSSLSQEYELLLKQGFTRNELWDLNQNAIRASFLEPTEKETLLQQFNVFWSEYDGGR